MNAPGAAPSPADDTLDELRRRLAQLETLALRRRRTDRERGAAQAAALAENEERFRLLVQHAGDIILVVTHDGIARYVSPSLERVLGQPAGDLVGAPVTGLVHPDDQPLAEQLFARCLQQPRAQASAEFRARHRDGSWRTLEVIATNLLDLPSVAGIVVNARDVTERLAFERQLAHQALHDTLTGLPNRALFLDRLSHAMAWKQRHPNSRYAVLCLDLDRFKVVNDSLGHGAGDELLVAVARRMERCLRPADTLARLGGDEFAILLEDLSHPGEVSELTTGLHAALAAPCSVAGQDLFTSASIGIAFGGRGYDRPDDLIRDADTALYTAKALGRGRHVVFDTGMHARAVARLRLESDLRRALERAEFRLHYQPIVALESGQLSGLEALVRWQHPRHGLLAPADFLPLAEETGLIVPLGRWVLSEACRQLTAWRAAFPHHAQLAVSVNLCSLEFAQPALLEQISAALSGHGLDANGLRLEITEGVIMDETELAPTMLQDLRAMGIRVQIDDFGQGYSSLGRLHRLPIDGLKIDRAFVSAMGPAGERSEIVRTVLGLAEALHVEAVAEGVETAAQHAQLQGLGCAYGQGYWFSRALPVAAAGALLAQPGAWPAAVNPYNGGREQMG